MQEQTDLTGLRVAVAAAWQREFIRAHSEALLRWPTASRLNVRARDRSLPDSVAADAAVNPESARLVGDYEGTKVWIALGAAEDHACLVIVPTNGDAQVACDFLGREISVSEGTAVTYLLVPNSGEAPDGDHLRLSTNVYVIAK
ncbi:MAG: hypothetical protein EOO27_17275 [Comamonadaceae bacterium]|nr:MAG: hypothetical protein EOO27_17275 [Comamonadaceae bacterium]